MNARWIAPVVLLLLLPWNVLGQDLRAPAPDIRRLMLERAPILLTLKQWDLAADEAVAQLPEILTALEQLPNLPPLASACATLPTSETPTDDDAAIAVACTLVGRARDVVERQYLASAKRAVRFAHLSFHAPQRYQREGRVAWHTLRMFATFEAEMAKRTETLRPYAQAIGLPILGELWREGFVARRQLREIMRQKRTAWPLPGDVTDVAFAEAVTAALPNVAQEGPLPVKRGELRQVRVIDPGWSVRALVGRPVRRERRAAVIWQPNKGPCYVTWLSAWQPAAGKKWGPLRLVWEDDVRQVKCPAQPPTTTGGR